jgi:hypothetical protein
MWPSAFSSRDLTLAVSRMSCFSADLDRQMRGDRVGELGRLLDLGDRADDVGRDLLVQLDVVLELGDHRAGQRLELHGRPLPARRRDRIGLEIGGRDR